MRALTRLAGSGLGAAALALAWYAAARPSGLFHPPALLAVLCAGGALILTQLQPGDLAAWRGTAVGDLRAAQARLVDLASVARSLGSRGLERELLVATQPLERCGLALLSDECKPAELQIALQQADARLAAADRRCGQLWRLASGALVNAGILVTVTAMIRALLLAPPAGSPTGPAAEALAGALTATVYGLAVGLLGLYPNVQRAQRQAEAAAAVRGVWLEGWLAIADGVHPRRLADRWDLSSQPDSPTLRRVA